MTFYLDGESLDFAQIDRIINQHHPAAIDPKAMKKILLSQQAVESHLQAGEVIYGINTGFGKFSDQLITSDQIEKLQINLLRSHACAVGEPFSERVVRLMLLLRANALVKGYSGVRPEVIQGLIDCLNKGVVPVVPSQGSLGASGDLAPLAHLALVLIGEGRAIYQGKVMPGINALRAAGLSAISLKAKEGLALINGTQAMTAAGCVAYMDAVRLMRAADRTAALTFETLRGVEEALWPETHRIRPFDEQAQVASMLMEQLRGSQLTTHQGELRVQDAYSLRCIPQVHGAVLRVLNRIREDLLIEINAATDNPLIFADSGHVISGGNFHGEPIAFSMDFLGIAIAELANISERRIERLVNPQLNNGLPAFLSAKPGLQSGFMITQYVAASLVSENKVLAHPASVDSIPSSANQEDHVSMGTTAARKAGTIIRNARKVIAIEALCGAQAADIHGPDLLADKTHAFYKKIRALVPFVTQDQSLSDAIDKVAKSF